MAQRFHERLHGHTGASAGEDAVRLSPRVLVVEDEMVVAMLVEDMLGELGYTVAGVAARIDDAIDIVEQGDLDLAILDVHLNGRLVFPVVDALMSRNVPFVFATAYGERGVPEHYRRGPILQKPFHADELEGALSQALEDESDGVPPMPSAHRHSAA